jgi:hypothetical protein
MPDLTVRPQSANGHTNGSLSVVGGRPQEVIKIYLEDHGPVRVPYRDLLTTWRLEQADPAQRAHIAAALADAGIASDRPLLEIGPEDSVELATRDANQNGSSPAIGISDALSVLDNAYEEYLNGIGRAGESLSTAEARYHGEVERRRQGLDEVDRNRLVLAVGRHRPVALYETAICTPDAEFALSPDVLAQVDIGPDEAVLDISGAGWRMVERFVIGHDIANVEELHWFAALTDVAVGRLEENPTSLADRRREALSEIGQAIGEREPVERAARQLVAAAAATEALDYTRLSAAAAVAAGPRRRLRTMRRARKQMAAVREAIVQAQEAVGEHARRVERESAQATAVSERLELPKVKTQLVLPE